MPAAARFLFVTWWGGGNLTPVLGLGPRMLARGHAVRVLGPSVLAERFALEGLPYRSHRTPGKGTGGDVATAGTAAEQGLARLRAMAEDVLDEVGREPTDAVVVDFMMPEALCAAERSGLPTAALVHTLFQPVADGEVDLVGAFTNLELIGSLRRGLGLAPVDRMVDLLHRAERILVAMPRLLDRRTTAAGANVRYLGPVLEEAGADAGWAPPAGEGGPLVVVSMGTTPMGEEPVLQRVLEATAGLPVRVFVTVAPHLDRAGLDVPGNATLSGYVRHAAVLPHADLLVNHGGLQSVVAALGFGVPVVCLPLGRDQPMNGARVAEMGAGRSLSRDAPVAEIREAIAEVLDRPRYRAAAGRVGQAAAADLRAGRAVLEMEGMLGR